MARPGKREREAIARKEAELRAAKARAAFIDLGMPHLRSAWDNMNPKGKSRVQWGHSIHGNKRMGNPIIYE